MSAVAEGDLGALWTRRGLIRTAPDASVPGWASHAQCPTPLILGERLWRVYFSVRDPENRSRILFVDLDPLDDMRVLYQSTAPLLELGAPGLFDSAGQGASLAVRRDGAVWLYYLGMHLRRDVPYGLAIGLARSTDGAAFERVADGPILSVGPRDPYFVSLLHARPAGAGWEGWYMSATGWQARSDGPWDAEYGLRRAVSEDGVAWRGTDVTLALGEGLLPRGGGIARPWVARVNGRDWLFFSRRQSAGFRTQRDAAYRIMAGPLDPAGTPAGVPRPVRFANPPEPEDWDGFMQAYPAVLPLGEGHVMFYNGDGFGQAGFGWATCGL